MPQFGAVIEVCLDISTGEITAEPLLFIFFCAVFYITFKPSENKNPNTQNILNADCSIIQPNVCATRCTIWNYVTFSSNLSFGTKLVGKFFFIHLRCACSYFIFRLTGSENQLHCKFVSFVYFVFIYKVFNLCEKNAKEKHNQTPSTFSKALRVCTIRKIIKKNCFFSLRILIITFRQHRLMEVEMPCIY